MTPRDTQAPSSPTTEAGQRFVDGDSPAWATVARAERAEIAVAIEQQARDEGRREGCSKHHSAEDCRAYFDQTLEEARDEGRREAVREIEAEVAAYQKPLGWSAEPPLWLRTILDRVAGLNASESPPTPRRSIVTDDRGWASDPLLRGFGDASESGQQEQSDD